MTSSTCPRCAGTNGNHGAVHVRHGNGGGHNEPCPNTPAPHPYPEHAKQEAVIADAKVIGDFITTGKYELGEWRDIKGSPEQSFMPVSTPIQQILAEYLGIDLDKIEAEKRAMIAALAAMNDTTP